jgi:hypothetical protein
MIRTKNKPPAVDQVKAVLRDHERALEEARERAREVEREASRQKGLGERARTALRPPRQGARSRRRASGTREAVERLTAA